jgi:hypothetical protein
MEKWNDGKKSKSNLHWFKPSIPTFQYSMKLVSVHDEKSNY